MQPDDYLRPKGPRCNGNKKYSKNAVLIR